MLLVSVEVRQGRQPVRWFIKTVVTVGNQGSSPLRVRTYLKFSLPERRGGRVCRHQLKSVPGSVAEGYFWRTLIPWHFWPDQHRVAIRFQKPEKTPGKDRQALAGG